MFHNRWHPNLAISHPMRSVVWRIWDQMTIDEACDAARLQNASRRSNQALKHSSLRCTCRFPLKRQTVFSWLCDVRFGRTDDSGRFVKMKRILLVAAAPLDIVSLVYFGVVGPSVSSSCRSRFNTDILVFRATGVRRSLPGIYNWRLLGKRHHS